MLSMGPTSQELSRFILLLAPVWWAKRKVSRGLLGFSSLPPRSRKPVRGSFSAPPRTGPGPSPSPGRLTRAAPPPPRADPLTLPRRSPSPTRLLGASLAKSPKTCECEPASGLLCPRSARRLLRCFPFFPRILRKRGEAGARGLDRIQGWGSVWGEANAPWETPL
jgi:hypothetical protein